MIKINYIKTITGTGPTYLDVSYGGKIYLAYMIIRTTTNHFETAYYFCDFINDSKFWNIRKNSLCEQILLRNYMGYKLD